MSNQHSAVISKPNRRYNVTIKNGVCCRLCFEGKSTSKLFGDYDNSMSSSPVTSLQVQQARCLATAAAAAAARQQAFYSRLLAISPGCTPVGEDHSHHNQTSGAFRPVALSQRFHPYDRRVHS